MRDPGSRNNALPERVVIAQAIREATLRVPGIVGMSRGRQHPEATYGPGITIWGVGLSYETERCQADVHVIARAIPLLAVAHEVRQAVQAAVRQISVRSVGPVNIYIDDVEFEEHRAPGP
ncbi:MAG: hypothetical protein NVS4B2_30050 [Chloroflexota bacterium]